MLEAKVSCQNDELPIIIFDTTRNETTRWINDNAHFMGQSKQMMN